MEGLSGARLRLYSKLICVSTFFLIFAGSLVTSTGSGLAVPDWPLSFGMVFPPMVGGVFYEHGHRMIASLVGCMVVTLAVWLWRRERRAWVKALGFLALGTVILQGVLGGITVIFFLPAAVSVSHAVLAQTFFLITIVIAYSLSREFERRSAAPGRTRAPLGPALFFAAAVFVQLVAGALMRHAGAGLAIPDFPLAAGRMVPRFDGEMLSWINAWRFEHGALDPVSMTQVLFHFAHRAGALLALGALLLLNYRAFRAKETPLGFKKGLLWIDALLTLQIALGGLTVLSGKAPFIASFHVAAGAGLLGLAALLALRAAPVSGGFRAV